MHEVEVVFVDTLQPPAMILSAPHAMRVPSSVLWWEETLSFTSVFL